MRKLIQLGEGATSRIAICRVYAAAKNTVACVLLFGLGVGACSATAQVTNVSLNPEADTFVRAAAPAANYGGAGSLTVSGESATNGFGVPGGRAESLARFHLDTVVPALDGAFGDHDWFIVAASLQLYEMGAPNNALFSRGIGAFEVRWLATHTKWQEGTGSPNMPGTNGVAFQDLSSLFDPANDLSLGIFTNSGMNGVITIPLSFAAPFVEDLRAASPVTLRFAPVDDSIGFTFLSRSDPRPDLRIALRLTVSAGPLPRISVATSVETNQVAIRFFVRSNLTHVLQSSADLAHWSDWFTLPAAFSNTEAAVVYTVTNRQRFFRLLVQP